jgi:hypothetical protein
MFWRNEVTTNNQPIDAATVQRCIEALNATGEYDRQWKRQPYTRGPGELIETWTYTTHPIDILKGLLPPPEKSEAEKLVDEFFRDRTATQVSDVALVQFVLDKQRSDNPAEVLRDIATELAEENGYTVDQWQTYPLPDGPFKLVDENGREIALGFSSSLKASPDDIRAINEALRNVAPQYVYGPWREWQGGECPVPGDWVVQVELDNEWADTDAEGNAFTDFSLAGDADTGTAEVFMWPLDRFCGNITHYRVRFEVGKWYDWNGGECPVEPDVRVEVTLRNGEATQAYHNPTMWRWQHVERLQSHDIIRFKIIGDPA